MRRVLLVVFCTGLVSLNGCNRSGSGSGEPGSSATGPVVAADVHPCKVTASELTEEDCAAAQYWLDQAKQGAAAFAAPRSMIQGQSRLVTLAIGAAASPPAAPTPSAPAPGDTNTTDTPTSTTGNTTTTTNMSGADELKASPLMRADAMGQMASISDPQTPHQIAAAALSGTSGTIVDYHPFVGRQVAADLEGDGFDVTPISPRVQPVVSDSVTTWSWRIKATAYGDRTLIMKTAVAMIDSQGKPNLLVPTDEIRKVKVYIGPSGVLSVILAAPAWLKALAAVLTAAAGLLTAWRAIGKSKPRTPKP